MMACQYSAANCLKQGALWGRIPRACRRCNAICKAEHSMHGNIVCLCKQCLTGREPQEALHLALRCKAAQHAVRAAWCCVLPAPSAADTPGQHHTGKCGPPDKMQRQASANGLNAKSSTPDQAMSGLQRSSKGALRKRCQVQQVPIDFILAAVRCGLPRCNILAQHCRTGCMNDAQALCLWDSGTQGPS